MKRGPATPNLIKFDRPGGINAKCIVTDDPAKRTFIMTSQYKLMMVMFSYCFCTISYFKHLAEYSKLSSDNSKGWVIQPKIRNTQLNWCYNNGLIKVDLEFSFSIPGLFQTWNSKKTGFEKLNSRSEPVFDKLNSRSELELSKKAIINWEKSSKSGLKLKYEVNLSFENQIWKPGPDLKMKIPEMRSWIPGLL